MEQELVQLFEAVQKAADLAPVDGGPEEDRCLDALNQLKKFPVNYHALVSTQVGKRLRGLTKHSSRRIKVLASEVVEVWKDIIIRETLKRQKNVEIKNEGSVEVDKVKSVKLESLAPVKDEKNNTAGSRYNEKAKSLELNEKIKTEMDNFKTGVKRTIDDENSSSRTLEHIKVKRTFKEEKSSYRTSEQMKVDWTIKEENSSSITVTKPKLEHGGPPKLNSVLYCKDQMRDKTREILAESLCKVSGEVGEDLIDEVNACDPYRVAVMVETAMFEKWGKNTGIQKAKYRSIMFNIKDSKNPDFRRKVLLGQFEAHSITELTPEQMASDALRQQNEKFKQKALFECERGQPQQASNTQFKCSRCGQKKTTYYQMQTRSADEPMTTYITCVNCNKRWKF